MWFKSHEREEAVDYSKLANEFDERGLLVIDQFWEPAKISEIERELHRYIAGLDPNRTDGHVVYEAGVDRKIRNIFHLHQADAYFAELAQARELTDLARAIFRDEPVLMSVELFGKP